MDFGGSAYMIAVGLELIVYRTRGQVGKDDQI
jgi:hypothetical protein